MTWESGVLGVAVVWIAILLYLRIDWITSLLFSVLYVCGCTVGSQKSEFERAEHDNGVLVGMILVPMVFATRCLVDPHVEYTLFTLQLSLSIGFDQFLQFSCRKTSRLALNALMGLLFPTPMHLFVTLLMHRTILSVGLQNLAQTFTMGEAMVISQGLSLYLMDFIAFFSSRAVNTTVFLLVPERDHVDIALQTGLLGTILAGCLLAPVFRQHGAPSPFVVVPPLNFVHTCLFYAVLLGSLLGVLVPCSSFLLDKNLIYYVVEFVLDDVGKIAMLLYWIVLLVLCLVGFPWIETKFNLSSIVARKLYHLLAVALFTPALVLQRDLLRLSLGIAVALLLVLEYMRAVSVPPVGKYIAGYMKGYLDRRDGGKAIVTHFCLLLGCAVPVWLNRTAHLLPAAAGIISLGIGDAAGAILGSTLGKIKVSKQSNKTLEGSLALFVSIGIASIVFLPALSSQLLLAVLLTSLIEAYTVQIDNIVLPLFYYSLCNLLVC